MYVAWLWQVQRSQTVPALNGPALHRFLQSPLLVQPQCQQPSFSGMSPWLNPRTRLLIATQGSEEAECSPPVTAWADSEELASNRRAASHGWPSSAYRHCTQRTALAGSAGEKGCGKTVARKRSGALSRALQQFVSQYWVWHVFTAPTSSCSPQIEPDSLLPGLARDVRSTLAAPTSRTGWSWPVRWRVTS